jgi:hypothetical protein
VKSLIFIPLAGFLFSLTLISCNTCEECSYKANNKTVSYPETCGTSDELSSNRVKCDSAAKANKTSCVCN